MHVKEILLVRYLKNILFLVVIFLFMTTACDDEIKPRLTINQGKIVGKTLKTVGNGKIYHAFQGIPYAEPPTGDLRFMPPKPLDRWEKTLYALNDNKKCPQKDAIFDQMPHGDEDCLVLNVYTPTVDENKKLSVMFWIHGGGFNAGSGSTDFFGPDNFMDENVVLVTTNYRLGVLGFLNLEDEVVTGNMGLKDIVMSLKWVKDNIESFGGNPDEVTIFGNNAGGAIVSLLTYSPMAKGLFNKAICQSGVYKLPQLFSSKGRERAFTLAKLLNKDPSDTQSLLKMFKKLSPYDFIKVAPKTFDSTEVRDVQKNIVPFGPTIERGGNSSTAFLPRSPDDTVDKLPDPNIPMMFGFNSREAIVYLRSLINSPDILDKLNYNFQFSLPLRGLQFVYNSDDYMEVANEIRKFYFEDGVISNRSLVNFVNYISDEIVYPVDKTLSEHLKISKAPVYYYRFSYEGSLNFYKRAVLDDVNSVSGASNGDEICYLFHCKQLKDAYDELYANERMPKDLEVSKRMVRLWANFAKYGDPTPENDEDDLLDGLKWNPTSPSRHDFLDIDSDFEMRQNPGWENVAFWDRIFDTYANVDKNINNANIRVEL